MYHRLPKIKGYKRHDIIAFMKVMLRTRPSWTIRACIVLYNQQSEREQKNCLSTDHNGIGFNLVDSPFLSKFTRSLKALKHMSSCEALEFIDQVKKVQLIIPKYAAQLVLLCFEKDDGKKLKQLLDQYYHRKELLPF